MRVAEAMTRDVRLIEPNQTIRNAALLMAEMDAGIMPVREGDRLVGMITDRDIIARVVAAGRDPSSVMVREVATKDLVTIGPDQDEQAARQMMAQHQLDRLLVVEEGDRLVGIISEADLRAEEGPLA